MNVKTIPSRFSFVGVFPWDDFWLEISSIVLCLRCLVVGEALTIGLVVGEVTLCLAEGKVMLCLAEGEVILCLAEGEVILCLGVGEEICWLAMGEELDSLDVDEESLWCGESVMLCSGETVMLCLVAIDTNLFWITCYQLGFGCIIDSLFFHHNLIQQHLAWVWNQHKLSMVLE